MILLNKKSKNLYQRAWGRWGYLQFIVAIEECSELQKAITKHLRGNDLSNVFEEVADVEIMIEQIRSLSEESNSKITEFKEKKLRRLSELLESIEKLEKQREKGV